jgi:hypothetical protein
VDSQVDWNGGLLPNYLVWFTPQKVILALVAMQDGRLTANTIGVMFRVEKDVHRVGDIRYVSSVFHSI